MVQGLQTDPVRLPLGGLLTLLVKLFLGGFPALLLLEAALMAPFLQETVKIPQQGVTIGSEPLLQLTQSGAWCFLGIKGWDCPQGGRRGPQPAQALGQAIAKTEANPEHQPTPPRSP